MGGLVAGRVPGQAPCSNPHPPSPAHIFNVPGITPELLGKRRDVAQYCPEMASAPHQDKQMPHLVEPEHPGPRVRTPQPVDDRAHDVD